MNSQETKSLGARIEKLNSLSKESLNAYYKMILEENILTNRGGAGLGLIEVARKSGSNMSYSFEESDNDFTFFSMETNINERESEMAFPVFSGVEDINTLKEFYSSDEQGILLINDREFYTKEALNKLLDYFRDLAPGFNLNKAGTTEIIHFVFDTWGSDSTSNNQGMAIHLREKKQNIILSLSGVTKSGVAIPEEKIARMNKPGKGIQTEMAIRSYQEVGSGHTQVLELSFSRS